jgi:hypothetical protein
MREDTKKSLVAVAAPSDLQSDEYDFGFYAIGYERRSRFIAASLAKRTKSLCGLEYTTTTALAISENRAWASEHNVSIKPLNGYRVDRDGKFRNFIAHYIEEHSVKGKEKLFFVDVSSMDRSLIGRLLNSIFAVVEPPFNLRLCYAPASFVEPAYHFVPARECVASIPELSGSLGIHQSSLSLLLGLGFEYGVSLGLLEKFEPDQAIVFMPTGTDDRYDQAVRKANFNFDFGIENIGLFQYRVNQPVALFESLFSITSGVSILHRVIIAPNGPKIFAALATVVGLFRAPQVMVLRASLAAQPPSHHIEADGSIVAIDFKCP